MSHIAAGRINHCPCNYSGTGQLGACPYFFWISLVDFDRYPFTVVNHNHEYNSISEFCERFYQIFKIEGGLGDSWFRYIWQVTHACHEKAREWGLESRHSLHKKHNPLCFLLDQGHCNGQALICLCLWHLTSKSEFQQGASVSKAYAVCPLFGAGGAEQVRL